MNKTISISRCIGTRLVSTSTAIKNSEAIIVDSPKDNYYKQFGVVKESAKPAGWDEALPYESIPGPKPLPIVGNIWRFFPYIGDLYNMEVLDMHKKFHQQHGKIVALRGIPTVKDVVMLFSPEDFETVHRNEGVFPIRDALKTFAYYRQVVRKDVFQDVPGITTVHGLDWYRMRSKVNPILMNPQTVLQYVDSMNHIASDFVTTIRHLVKSDPNGEMPDDFINYIYRWTLESVCYVALDRRLGCLNPHLAKDSEPLKLINHAVEMFYLYYLLEVQPSMWLIRRSKNWNRFVEILDTMTYTFLKYVDEATIKFNEEKEHKEEHNMTVFQRLLKTDSKVALTMALDLLTAGVDTTGKTTGAILYYLSKNPNVQNKLREELCTLLPNKNSPVTKDVLSNAPYLKAVIKESIRLAPISVGNFRAAIKDMVLCGYRIPKGTNVLTSNLLLCHSEEHFPRSKEFIPERWLRSTKDEISFKNTHSFVYLPFGFGPRSCIGKRLANLEIEVGISKIIRNFTLEWRHEDMTFQSIPLYGVKQPLKFHFKEVDQ